MPYLVMRVDNLSMRIIASAPTVEEARSKAIKEYQEVSTKDFVIDENVHLVVFFADEARVIKPRTNSNS